MQKGRGREEKREGRGGVGDDAPGCVGDTVFLFFIFFAFASYSSGKGSMVQARVMMGKELKGGGAGQGQGRGGPSCVEKKRGLDRPGGEEGSQRN